jgi:hypothetical protein
VFTGTRIVARGTRIDAGRLVVVAGAAVGGTVRKRKKGTFPENILDTESLSEQLMFPYV